MFRLSSMIDVDEGFYQVPTLSTAGAVTIKDEKGRLVTRKVKVHRYVAGKRPEYAAHSADESDYEQMADETQPAELVIEQPLSYDRRLRRLLFREVGQAKEERIKRHFEEHEEKEDEAEKVDEDAANDEMSDEEITRRRDLLRQKLAQQNEEELLVREGEECSENEQDQYSGEEEFESEDEDSEDEMAAFSGMPRLKPVFVKKRDRATLAEREAELARMEKLELEAKRRAEEQRRHTLQILEQEIKREQQEERKLDQANSCGIVGGEEINTDDENDGVEYEKWKLRELKRLKRDREAREEKERERIEAERNRLLAESGRMEELHNMQRVVVNKEIKGKYKFLQKYYHRGAFYLDKEDPVYKRDFSAPTLEDHFDKTILPKVMQVKNFGMAGRTKYTHLVDQDTTCFDSPWAVDKVQVLRFHNTKGGGMKQSFDRPSLQRRKA